jgi:glucose uptake protein GlcU
MCIEQIIGFSALALILVGYTFSRITRNVNWAMLGRYLRHMLSTW